MAVITPSSLISEIRGSVGDVTYSRNRYGAYVKAKLVQPASSTADQVLRRDALAAGVLSYHSLADDEFKAWKAYVDEKLRSKNISRKITLAAFNEYCGRYVNRSLIEGVATGFSPWPSVRNFPYIESVSQSFESIIVDFFSENFQSGTSYVIYATPPVEQSIRYINKSNYKVLTYISADTATESLDIFSMYDAVYNLTGANAQNRIGLAVKAVNDDNFASGKLSYYNFIIDSTTIRTAAVVQQEKYVSGGTSTSVTFSFNSVPNEDDLMIIFVSTTQNNAITPPGGWTTLVEQHTNYPALYCFYKIAGAAEGNSYTFTQGSSYAIRAVGYTITGADNADPFAFSSVSTTYPTASTSVDIPASPITVPALTLVLAACSMAGDVSSPAFDNSFTNLVPASGGGRPLQCARKTYSSGDTSQDTTFTHSISRIHTRMFIGVQPT